MPPPAASWSESRAVFWGEPSPAARRWEAWPRWVQTFIGWRLYNRNPVPLPWFFPRGLTPAARRILDETYAHELERCGRPGAGRQALMVIGWAALMARSCARHYWKHRRLIRRERPDVRGPVLLWRLLVCVFANNISPMEFYRFKFYLTPAYRRRQWYLQQWQLSPTLTRAFPAAGPSLIPYKDVFWRMAARAGVAAVPVVAVVRDGAWEEGRWAEIAARRQDLVLKPTNRGRGEGVEFIDPLPGGRWRVGAHEFDDAQAGAWIEEQTRLHPVILQRRMRNHPDLARYGTEGVATLRVITMKTRAMPRAECVAAALRIPFSSARLANLHRGALVCAIELATGAMAAASSIGPACENVSHHPVTGAPLAGERVPCWEECKALCIAGHDLAPEMNSVGWDVIVTPDGPRLLEANLRWGCHVLQIAGGAPLLTTRFVDLYERPDANPV